MADVFDRIRRALEGSPTAEEIEATIRAAEAAAADNLHWRGEHEAVIVDPLSDTHAVTEADRSLAATHVMERRLAEAVRRLTSKLAEVRESDEERERRIRFDRAKAIRDKAVAEVRDAWTKHAKGLAAVVAKMQAVDAEVSAAYDRPPKGEVGLDSVVAGLVRPGLFPNGTVPFFHHLNLPDVPEWGAPGYSGPYVRTRLG